MERINLSQSDIAFGLYGHSIRIAHLKSYELLFCIYFRSMSTDPSGFKKISFSFGSIKGCSSLNSRVQNYTIKDKEIPFTLCDREGPFPFEF